MHLGLEAGHDAGEVDQARQHRLVDGRLGGVLVRRLAGPGEVSQRLAEQTFAFPHLSNLLYLRTSVVFRRTPPHSTRSGSRRAVGETERGINSAAAGRP